MTATIATISFVFSILLLVANGSYSSPLETYSNDPEDVSHQDYDYKSDLITFERSDEEKYSDPKEGITKNVQQSTNSHNYFYTDKLLAARFNKINYDIKNIQKSQAQVLQKVIKLDHDMKKNFFS